MRNFRLYSVWQRSHELTLSVYKLVKGFPDSERYSLTSQVLRAAYSIPSNFAEGCGRSSDKEFNRFIQISLGSCCELEYFLILSKDLDYISEDNFLELSQAVNTIKKQLFTLSQKLSQ